MTDEKAEMREHLDQTQLVSAIYRQLQKCDMNEEKTHYQCQKRVLL